MTDSGGRRGPGISLAAGVYAVVRWLTDAAMAVATLSVLGLLGLVCYSVGVRYILDRPEPWVDEMVGYVLVASVMFAVAEALRKGEHISVDVLTERLGPAARRVVHVLGLVAVLVTAAILVTEGWGMVAFSRMAGIRSIGYLEIPIWTAQIMVPVGGVLLFLAAAAELVRVAAGLPPDAEEKQGDHPTVHQRPGIE
ncbi:MAG: TRAP transporter small permease [Betaproteobacteria bacterium]|nr:TRAP transporter small permease [Betaproteobacteria bacterium]